MAEEKAQLTPIERIRKIADKPLAKVVLAGAAIGTAIGGLTPLPNSSQVTSPESPKPTAALVDEAKTPSPTLETQPIKTATPTMSPEPTRAPIVGATAPRETPPPKIEFFTKDGELSYNSFFYFQRETKPEERERVIKEIVNKPSTILIDRSDVWAWQPSRNNSEFFVIGPEGRKYAYVNLGDGYPILVTPEQYLDFLNKGWVGGRTGRKEIWSRDDPYLSYRLMKGTKLEVEVVNLPRPNGETKPTFIFKGIAVPEVDPNRPTDFMTKEGDISFEKFFNAKNTWSSILSEMLGEMAGKEVSILFDKEDVSVFSPRDSQQLGPDGKPYKETFLSGGTSSFMRFLLTADQAESFEKTGWNLESRTEFKGRDPFFTEKIPLGAKIKVKIMNEPDEYGRMRFIFQGINLPQT